MKKWSREIEIDAPIEQVWALFDGSLEDMQKIMPQVTANESIEETDEIVGSIHLQKFKEGKQVMEYLVETLEYVNTPEEKKKEIGFTLADIFEVTRGYELIMLDDHKTLFKYTSTNRALKLYVRLFSLFASNKVSLSFVQRVKEVAETKD